MTPKSPNILSHHVLPFSLVLCTPYSLTNVEKNRPRPTISPFSSSLSSCSLSSLPAESSPPPSPCLFDLRRFLGFCFDVDLRLRLSERIPFFSFSLSCRRRSLRVLRSSRSPQRTKSFSRSSARAAGFALRLTTMSVCCCGNGVP